MLGKFFAKKEKFNIDKEEILYEGFLTKKGEKVQNWKKRYFVLTPNHVSYFSSEKKNPKENLGFIKLPGSTLGTSEEKKFCFTIKTPERTYLLFADTEVSMNTWMEKINGTLGQNNSTQEQEQVKEITITSPSLKLASPKLNEMVEQMNSDKSLEVLPVKSEVTSPDFRESKRNLDTLITTPTKNELHLSIDYSVSSGNGRGKLLISETEEYFIFQSALHIFLKQETDRTTEVRKEKKFKIRKMPMSVHYKNIMKNYNNICLILAQNQNFL
jgi:hypothetical protein